MLAPIEPKSNQKSPQNLPVVKPEEGIKRRDRNVAEMADPVSPRSTSCNVLFEMKLLAMV